MIRDVRTVLRWLAPRERWPWLGLVPLVSISALIEAGGALATFGLLRLVVEPEQVRTAPVVSQLWRAWPTDDPRAVVATLALGVGGFYLARALFLSVTAIQLRPSHMPERVTTDSCGPRPVRMAWASAKLSAI